MGYFDPRLSILSVIKIRKDLGWSTVPVIKRRSGNVLSLGDDAGWKQLAKLAVAPGYLIHAGFLRIEGGVKCYSVPWKDLALQRVEMNTVTNSWNNPSDSKQLLILGSTRLCAGLFRVW